MLMRCIHTPRSIPARTAFFRRTTATTKSLAGTHRVDCLWVREMRQTKRAPLRERPAEDGLRTPRLREQKPELVEHGVGVDASGANRTPSGFWHTDWRTANEGARTRDGLRCPEQCPRSETWRMPEEVPEGC